MENRARDLLRRAILVGPLISAFGVALQACRSGDVSEPTITIQSISPSNDSPLLAGQELTVEAASLGYNLPDGAIASIIVQTAAEDVLAVVEPIQIKGGVIFRLSARIKIPVTSNINVNVAVYKDTQSDSIAVDRRDFRVVGTQR